VEVQLYIFKMSFRELKISKELLVFVEVKK